MFKLTRQAKRFRASANAVAMAKSVNHGIPRSKRTRGSDRLAGGPFMPTEDWHEPGENSTHGEYKIVVQTAGDGYRHAVTATEVRQRLAELPEWMLDSLRVVQLSRMTRKKQTFPCYGMQWGHSLYLYPIEDSLVETFVRPPKPSVYNEVKQFGGRWLQDGDMWTLEWTDNSLRNFYLNNILIHELGHLLDDRNNSYTDRERYAEWFALEFGYKPSADRRRQSGRRIVKRHHGK